MTWRAIKLRLETADTLELGSFVDSSEFLSSERSVLIQSANFLRKRGSFSECLKIIEFLKAAPNDEGEKLLFLLGDLFHDTKEFEECVKIYSDILARKPSDIAFNNRGLALWELKRFQEAYDDYISALNINPLNTTALRGAGEMSLKLFWYEQAEGFFERAIGQNSDYVMLGSDLDFLDFISAIFLEPRAILELLCLETQLTRWLREVSRNAVSDRIKGFRRHPQFLRFSAVKAEHATSKVLEARCAR